MALLIVAFKSIRSLEILFLRVFVAQDCEQQNDAVRVREKLLFYSPIKPFRLS